MAMFLHSIPITGTSSLLRTSPPLFATSLLSASPFCGLCLFDLHRRSGSCVPHRGLFCAHAAFMPDAGQTTSGLPLSFSQWGGGPLVLTSYYAIDTSSTVHFRSSSQNAHACFIQTFPSRSLPCLLSRAAEGCLASLPDQFLPRGLPSSSLQFSQHTNTVRAFYGIRRFGWS